MTGEMIDNVGTPKVAKYTDGSTKMLYRYKVTVVGGIWMPLGALASYDYYFDAEDNEDAINRVPSKAGDFSSITDFELSVWGELCPHCHHHSWLPVKKFSQEGEEAYINTLG